jgi:lipoprotein signal peptidase
MNNSKHYWFPVRRYGWGWGLPIAWQGWVVLAAYLVSLLVLWVTIPPGTDPNLYALGFLLLTVGLVVVCWLKGEPPRWRWGK